jgi:hypothetical protein
MTDQDTPIVLSFDYERLPIARLAGWVGVKSRRLGVRELVVGIGILVAVFGAVPVLTSFGYDGEFGRTAFLAGLFAGNCLIWLAERMGRQRRRRAHIHARSGTTTMTLDPTGVKVAHPGLRSTVDWPFVVAVHAVDDALLTLISEVEFFPAPLAALPPGISPEELTRRIAHWRSAVSARTPGASS